jgi:hypothetical protein
MLSNLSYIILKDTKIKSVLKIIYTLSFYSVDEHFNLKTEC